ncbi:MAG: AI-2E family transporter [Candidatus Omnitrophica bacterium]|nr:AI-2E family transporter [Candidatus Omnitrophota bacterium]
MAVLLILVGWLHLATLLLTTLFGFFALQIFNVRRLKWVALSIYFTVVLTVGFGLFHFSKRACVELPKIIDTTIPAVVEYAERQNLELPFTDYASLKTLALSEAKDKIVNVGRYAGKVGVELALVIIGLVVAAGIFLNGGFVVEGDPHARQSGLYAQTSRELARRFQNLYMSFKIVMGAQIVISAINTALTWLFIVANGFPYVTVILVLTFLCGLLPIIGNIMSNILIVGVGFTLSPKMALLALVFLVAIHKLEYFLNSTIIGHRIKNPMWLTLISLVIGEKLMGIPGMILAPVVFHYVKVEVAGFHAAVATPASSPPEVETTKDAVASKP